MDKLLRDLDKYLDWLETPNENFGGRPVCPFLAPDRKKGKIEPSKKDSWNKLSNWSRRCYLSQESPGIKKQEPTSGFSEKYYFNSPSTEESEKGLQNFSVIEIIAEEIEWLFLASQGHRRILFDIKRAPPQKKMIYYFLTFFMCSVFPTYSYSRIA